MIPFGLGAAIRLVSFLNLIAEIETHNAITSDTITNITNLISLFYGSTRVSNELGAGRPAAAKLAVQVILCLALTGGIIVGSVLILIRGVWGYAYSNEEEVVNYVAIMLPILAISNMFDSIQSVLSGKYSILFILFVKFSLEILVSLSLQ